jgi:hypothetical protein
MTQTRREMAWLEALKATRVVAAQKKRVERMRSEGRDTANAERLLAHYERVLDEAIKAIVEDDLTSHG